MSQDINKRLLPYWIKERERIRVTKESGAPKPWSQDWVFQQTYFCNVRREDDRVTRWVRSNWSPEKIGWDDYEYAMVLARFLNWPDTLAHLTYVREPEQIYGVLQDLAEAGKKFWGNAYVVTTHGLPMGKAQYLCQRVLPNVYEALGAAHWRGQYAGSGPLLARRYEDYKQFEGMASFMSAQVVADLKNTPGHPLHTAEDWASWSAPGPGSLRGLAWFHGKTIRQSERAYNEAIAGVADYLNQFPEIREILAAPNNGPIHMQDLQNCLCEFDKYMRVRSGTGRSKRGYPGK